MGFDSYWKSWEFNFGKILGLDGTYKAKEEEYNNGQDIKRHVFSVEGKFIFCRYGCFVVDLSEVGFELGQI